MADALCYTISNVCQLINNLMLAENAIIAFTFGICESSFNIIKVFFVVDFGLVWFLIREN